MEKIMQIQKEMYEENCEKKLKSQISKKKRYF